MTATVDMLRIKNTNINSGAYVNCYGVQITPGYKKINQAEPVSGQLSTGNTEFIIGSGQQSGIEPPVFAVSGILNLHDFNNDTALYATTGITDVTLGFLKALWRDATGQTYVKIKLGLISNQLSWKTYDDGSEEIPVLVDSFNPLPMQDSEGRHMIAYTLQLKEIV